MSRAKTQWIQPQLIVLTRGTPEESVLLHCKRIGWEGSTVAPQEIGQTGCDELIGTNCGACQARASS